MKPKAPTIPPLRFTAKASDSTATLFANGRAAGYTFPALKSALLAHGIDYDAKLAEEAAEKQRQLAAKATHSLEIAQGATAEATIFLATKLPPAGEGLLLTLYTPGAEIAASAEAYAARLGYVLEVKDLASPAGQARQATGPILRKLKPRRSKTAVALATFAISCALLSQATMMLA